MMKKVVAVLLLCTVCSIAASQDFCPPVSVVHMPVANTSLSANNPLPWIVVFEENFELGMMPSGWVAIDGNGDGSTWTVGTTNDGHDPPDCGTAYLYYSDDDAGMTSPAAETLITTSYCITRFSDLRFSYSYDFEEYDLNTPPVEYGEIHVRFFNSGSWDNWILVRQYFTDTCGWDTIQLGSYLPADSIQLKFVYWEESPGDWAWGFYLDNFLLEGETSFRHDVAVVGIQPRFVGLPGSQNVVVSVANFGGSIETFPLYVYITGPTTGEADTTLTVEAGETLEVCLGSFNFEEGIYNITAYTALTGDELPDNDTFEVSYNALISGWIQYDDDSAADGWQWPTGSGNRGFGMRFDITNGYIIDSVFVGLTNSSKGSQPSRLVIYADDGGLPGDVIWEIDTSLSAPAWPDWAGYVIPTDGILVSTSPVYFFWYDVTGGDGQYLCIDGEPSLPFEYYWADTGVFYNYVPDTEGDWLLRLHVIHSTGVSEWIPSEPYVEVFMAVSPVVIGDEFVTINLSTERRVNVDLRVYDAAGRLVDILYRGQLRGQKTIKWSTDKVGSGVYFVRLVTENLKSVSRKVLVVK